MELILISNTKLKIMLDEEDMRKYNIAGDSDCTGSAARRAIRSLLECAREQIGFNTAGEEIFVQLYATKRGGCELFVTKCASEQVEERVVERIKSPILQEGASCESKSKKPPMLPDSQTEPKLISEREAPIPTIPTREKSERGSRIAFSFSSMKDLITVCRILDSAEIYPESRAYFDDSGNFYLLLQGTKMSAYSRLDRLTFIVEYGKRENPDCLVSYISEHGRVICQSSAIETLCTL